MKRLALWTLMLLVALATACGGSNGEASDPEDVAAVFSEPQRDQYWVMLGFTEALQTPDVTEQSELIKIVVVGFALGSNAASGQPLLVVRLHSSDRTYFYIVTKDTFDRFANDQASTEDFLGELRIAKSEGELQELRAKLAAAGM